MKPEQERVRNLLTDTVTLLCKNGLHYKKELRVQGLLGITLDDSEVFVVHINEKFGDLLGGSMALRDDPQDAGKLTMPEAYDGSEQEADGDDITAAHVNVKRQRRSSSDNSLSPVSSPGGATESQQILHRPIKRLLTSTPLSSLRSEKRASHLNSSRVDRSVERTVSGETVEPAFDVDVKVKTEDDDLMIVGDDRSCDPAASANLPHNAEAAYPGLSLNEIQGNYQHFEQILGLANASGDPGGGEPAAKRHATQDLYSQSGAAVTPAGDLVPGMGGPFITGLRHNQSGTQDTANSTWDSSQNSSYALDGQGSVTWDPARSAEAARQAISGTEQGSDSMRQDERYNPHHVHIFKTYRPRHSLNKPYMCAVVGCGKTYYRKFALQRHQDGAHNSTTMAYPTQMDQTTSSNYASRSQL